MRTLNIPASWQADRKAQPGINHLPRHNLDNKSPLCLQLSPRALQTPIPRLHWLQGSGGCDSGVKMTAGRQNGMRATISRRQGTFPRWQQMWAKTSKHVRTEHLGLYVTITLHSARFSFTLLITIWGSILAVLGLHCLNWNLWHAHFYLVLSNERFYILHRWKINVYFSFSKEKTV